MYSVALSGLSFVLLMFLYQGLAPPSVVYRAFGAYLPDTNIL